MGGFFGVVSKENCASDLFYGTDYHSHLGTLRGGMALWAEGHFHRSIHDISNSPFRTRFESDFLDFNALDARSGVGVISDTDDQPLLFLSHHGTYALVTVGLIANIKEIVATLLKSHAAHFSAMQNSNVTQTEVIGTLINTQETLEEGIRYAQETIEGACSLLLLKDGHTLYAARDRFGRTPIVLGKKDSGFCAAFESCSLPNLGYESVRDLGPGEVAKITCTGVETVVEPSEDEHLCGFLFVYFGYPASNYSGRNVEQVRYHCGSRLARRHPVDADIIAGIPDSGVGHALGYAQEANIRYARPFVKYTPTWPRSFTPADPSIRHRIAEMKLIPIQSIIQDRRIVFCDDSMVRGTQLRTQTQRMRDLGAQEVHIRIACPPLFYPCKFLNFTRPRSPMDLITRRIIRDIDGDQPDLAAYSNPDGEPYKKMLARLSQNMKIDSLAFQHLDDLKAAIGLRESARIAGRVKIPQNPTRAPQVVRLAKKPALSARSEALATSRTLNPQLLIMIQSPPKHAISTTYRVPYADTDMMGVVYYGNYLTYFERSRNELMRATGVTYQEMENDGAMLPVIEAHVNYHSPARYDDLLTITAWVEKVTRVKMKICCIVTRGDDVLATGYTVHACISTTTLRPVRIPEYLQNSVTKCDLAENG